MDIENLAGKWSNVAINPKTEKTYESEYLDNGVSVPMCPNNSREELEADVWALTTKWKSYKGNFMKIYSSVAYAQIKELLDRQAAITKNECREEHSKRLGELHDLLDEAAREREELAGRVEYNGELVEKVKRERNNLQYENDALIKEINRLRKVCQIQADSFAAIENENAKLRSKLNRIRELAERLQDA